ncbi:hypothetical protein HPB50_007762 [Hyalomma asiaticum]|uniref:Uncharacterized protein n=1 Tax=Hyalomma asiaticum TaxID=266040 RepID=A0ACB7S278_HYAAI|nr:hypothetical protein HPB50_007762 [Hyalomma asiaticum]
MVHASSTPVPLVSHLRVLGLILQSNHRNTHTIDQLSLSVQQTAGMLARVRARREESSVETFDGAEEKEPKRERGQRCKPRCREAPGCKADSRDLGEAREEDMKPLQQNRMRAAVEATNITAKAAENEHDATLQKSEAKTDAAA